MPPTASKTRTKGKSPTARKPDDRAREAKPVPSEDAPASWERTDSLRPWPGNPRKNDGERWQNLTGGKATREGSAA